MPEPVNLEGIRAARKSAKPARQSGAAVPPGDTPGVAEGPLPPCPVVALGHRAGMYYFLDVHGQERSLSARQLGTRMDVSGLFDGVTTWLQQAFPSRRVVKEKNEAGQTVEVERVVGYATAQAGEWLMRACGQAGMFGDHIVIRRPGIWAGPDGAPIVHCGDVVLVAGRQRAPGYRLGDTVFAADGATARPSAACGPEEGRWLLADMRDLWRWRNPGGEILALGLVGTGMLGAAARWRPNGFVLGGPGSGKSKLLQLLNACAPVNHYTNDTTKEGISQAVNRMAMPIFIDEASDRQDQKGAQALMDLVLAATGDGGAKALRGTSDGRGRSVEVVGVIVMASVAPPEMQAQHAARFTQLELVKPEAGADNAAEMAVAIERARSVGPALWGRMLEGWARWLPSLDAFRAALGHAGCAPREMDQVGAMLASWWVLTEDGVPDVLRARDGVAAVRAYARLAIDVAETDGGRQASQHLLSSKIQRNHTTDMLPVAELLEHAWMYDGMDSQHLDAVTHLGRHGIRPIRGDQDVDRQGRPVPRMGAGDGVWLSNTSGPLLRLFGGTAFEGQRWRFALLQLESARKSLANVRIGSISGAAIWVGRACLMPPEGPWP